MMIEQQLNTIALQYRNKAQGNTGANHSGTLPLSTSVKNGSSTATRSRITGSIFMLSTNLSPRLSMFVWQSIHRKILFIGCIATLGKPKSGRFASI